MTEQDRTSREATEGELFRLLVENVRDYAVFVVDPEGRVRSWNPGAERLLGYAEGEIVGRPIAVFFTPEDIGAGVPEREMRQAQDEGRGNDDRWHVRKDGSRFWCGGTVTPLWDDDRKLRGFAKIMRDRTDWKLREEALEERVRLAAFGRDVGLALTRADSLPDMLRRSCEAMVLHLHGAFARIWTLDATGTILVLQASAGRYTHLDGPHGRVPVGRYKIGLIAEERKPHLTNAVREDPRVSDPAWAEREGMVAFAGYPLVVEERLVGVVAMFARRPLSEATLEAMASVAHGVALGIERKRAEEGLREQREWLRTTLSSIGDAVIATDTEGRVTFLNPVAEVLTGWSEAEAHGAKLETVFRIVHETTRRPVENPVARVLREGHVVGLANHTVLIARDGTEWPIDDSAAPIWDGRRNLQGVVLVFRDIGEKKRAEAEVRRAGEQARTILESITDGFFTLDREWKHTYVNPEAERILGRRSGDLLGKVLWEEYPGTVGSEFERTYRRAIAERVAGSLTAFYPDHDRWYEVRAYPAAEGLSVYFRDVSERRRAERALERSEARKTAMFEAALDCIISIDHEGAIVEFNAAAESTFGHRREDVLGRELAAVIIPPAFRELHRNGLVHYLATGEGPVINQRLELSALRADGTEFPVELTVTRIPVDGPPQFTAYLRDITERKRAEEAVRESEHRLRFVMDSMPQKIFTATPRGDLDYFNPIWTEFTGLSFERIRDWGWTQFIHPDDVAENVRVWKHSVDTGAPFALEHRFRRHDGEYRWHVSRAVPMRDEAGRVVMWIGSNTDIYDVKQAEQTARFVAGVSAALADLTDAASTFQKVAVMTVPHFADWCAVDMLDEDGHPRRVAVMHTDPEKVQEFAALLEQYPPRPADPHGILKVIRTGESELLEEITDATLANVTHDADHLRRLKALGLRSHMLVPIRSHGRTLGVVTFITAESGRPYTAADLVVAEDLARRAAVAVENARLYQALQDADRRKDEFLATLAHELRNPLAPIRNALQILKMPGVDAAVAGRSRDMMERQVHHLVRLVDDLLDVSRVMRGKIDLRRERVELATIVARAVETVQPLIEAQGHDLGVRMPSEPLWLDADPVRLAQVVGNLLTNAAKYTEPNGRIRLSAEREGAEAVLRIRDNGIGIGPDMLPRVFELFVQVDHAATRSQGGLGIGLTLVKNLVELHRGTVAALSGGLSQGSEFVVRLPLLRNTEPGAQEAASSGSPSALRPRHSKRLLVVDDNRDAAVSLAMLLELQGHEVRVAHSGPAALKVVEGFSPDAVFLDIGMPGMDGYEVARRLRRLPSFEKVVLAALTGWGQPEDRRRTTEAGFDHHLVKPPEPKALENLLANLTRTPR